MDTIDKITVELETVKIKSVKANLDRRCYTVTLEGYMPLDPRGLIEIGPKLRRLQFLQIGEQPIGVVIEERQATMPGFAPVGESAPSNEAGGAVITWDADNLPSPEEIDQAVAIAVEEARHKPDPIHAEIMEGLNAQQEQGDET